MLTQPLQAQLTAPKGTPLSPQAGNLTRHLRQCRQASSLLFVAASWAERAHSQLAPRFVTTITAAFIVITVLCAWG